MFSAFAFAVAGYLLGSISSAILVCRIMGKPDPRSIGSGNPGATNVLRGAGKVAAAATLAGDVLKGLLPVALANAWNQPPLVLALAGLGALLGHIFPVFFGFRGGKGVATFIGVLFGLTPWLGAAFCGVWLATAALTRYSSLAALVATLVTPVIANLIGLPASIGAALAAMAVAIYWRHRDNIARLRAGTESRIGQRRA